MILLNVVHKKNYFNDLLFYVVSYTLLVPIIELAKYLLSKAARYRFARYARVTSHAKNPC